MLEWSTAALKREVGVLVPTDGSGLPWFLSGLAGLVSWFAALFCLCWLGACLAQVDESWLVLGVVFAFFGAALARSQHLAPDLLMVVLSQLGLIASIVGRLLLIAGFTDLFGDGPKTVAGFVCMIELGFIVLYPQSIQRFYSVFAGLCALAFAFDGAENAATREILGGLSALAAGTLLWFVHACERRIVRLEPRVPFVDTRVLSNLAEPVGMGFAAWTLCLEGLRFLQRSPWDGVGLAYGVLALIVVIALVVEHGLQGRQRVGAVFGGVLLVVLGRFVPGMPLAVVFALIAIHRRNTKLAGLALVFAYLYAGLFYYELHVSLLTKGLALLGGGVLLLGLRAATVVEWGSGEPVPAPSVWARSVATVALLGVLGLVVGRVASAELALAGGERVYLKLAPVDPRSLVQGDYMTLGYELDSAARKLETGRAVAQLDERGVLVQLHPDKPTLAADERWIQVSPARPRQSRIANRAYLFQEGTAAVYEDATYGIFALSGEDLLLVGLAGDDLEPLGTARPAW